MIRQAKAEDMQAITKLVQDTIDAVYPKYYPAGAVSYFKALHNSENVRSDIKTDTVYLAEEDGTAVGTVTVQGNHILRLFVLPAYQRRGIGAALLDCAEDLISERYDTIEIDASFPAKALYRKRGYADAEFYAIETENGDFLCYDVMRKAVRDDV